MRGRRKDGQVAVAEDRVWQRLQAQLSTAERTQADAVVADQALPKTPPPAMRP